MQLGRLHNRGSGKRKIRNWKSTLPKVITSISAFGLDLSRVAVLRAIPHPEGLQMGSPTKKFDVIIIVSPFISPHD